jgi:hypothetical protein
MANTNARQSKPSDRPQTGGNRADLNFSVAVNGVDKDGKATEKLLRTGGLWSHRDKNGFGGYFLDTGSGREVRVVLFEPKDGEFDSQRNPAFKVFVEHRAATEGGKSELLYGGLVWQNANNVGFNGYLITNLLTGSRIRIVLMPPRDPNTGGNSGSASDDNGLDDDIPF